VEERENKQKHETNENRWVISVCFVFCIPELILLDRDLHRIGRHAVDGQDDIDDAATD
jgi:hypothetical protein